MKVDSDEKWKPAPRGTFHYVFNAPDADVAFRSADGIAFRLHKVNLSVTTGAFSAGVILGPAPDDYVDLELPETADTLEVLFGFVYPKMRRSTIGEMEFDKLARLAEAAEKYEVFVAMDICRVRMSEQVTSHPIEVLNYAFAHGYKILAEEAAFLTVDQPLDTILEKMSPDLIVHWLHYYSRWMRLVTINDIRQELELHGHWQTAGVICPYYQQTVAELAIPQCVRHAMTTIMLDKTWGFPCDENCRETWKEVAEVLQGYVLDYASTIQFGDGL